MKFNRIAPTNIWLSASVKNHRHTKKMKKKITSKQNNRIYRARLQKFLRREMIKLAAIN